MSTVKNADHIVALSEGKVAEVGTHNELLQRKGVYFQLVMAQERAEKEVNYLPYKGFVVTETEIGNVLFLLELYALI